MGKDISMLLAATQILVSEFRYFLYSATVSDAVAQFFLRVR
jgi:hypothetical protein